MPDALAAGQAGGGDHAAASEDQTPAGDAGGGGGSEGGEEGQGQHQPAVSVAGRPAKRRITDRELEIALKVSGGNIAVAALALETDKSSLTKRVKRTPHLYALHGERTSGEEITPPTPGTTLLRSPDEIPVAPSDPQLGTMVIQTEKLIRDGLEKIGVPATTIARLKAFDGLAVGAGAFLAQSLQDTHQIYYVNLLKLDEMAADIKRRYLDPGATEGLADLERMFWQRAYNEIVDQLGKGYDRMLSGTQAMVAMMKAQRDRQDGNGKMPKSKPGF